LLLWALSTLLTLALFCYILFGSKRSLFPLFAAYLGTNLLQTVLQLVVYQYYGTVAKFPYGLIWGSQAVVVTARALSAAEFCRRVLGMYRGVWAVAWRILLFCGLLILTVAVYFGRDGMRLAVMTLDIGSEGFVATLAAGTFLFVRHYDVPMEWSEKLFGMGLTVYSGFKIVNDAIVTRYVHTYGNAWNEIAMVVFIGVVALWLAAVHVTVGARALKPATKPDDSEYRTLIPVINERLWQLDQQLSSFWNAEQPKP